MEKDKRSIDIMVIEDNPGDYLLIEEFLDDYFMSVHMHHARSYKEAIEITKERDAKPFDVVLLDLSLPDAGGEVLIRDALALCEPAPVIALTGYSDITFSRYSLNLGVTDYLLKDELSSTILYKSIIYNIDRKKFINSLRESRRRYKELFHLSPQPMFVIDLETLQFMDVNRAAVNNYGYTQDEFLKMSVLDIKPVEDRDTSLKLIADSLETSVKSDELLHHNMGILRHKKKNGDVIYVELRYSDLLSGNRQARLVLASDVTERMHHIEAIELQNQKLKDIAWMQSHVVRAPLARLMGLVQLMKETAPDDRAELTDLIMGSADELDQIIRDISENTERIETWTNGRK